EWTSLNDLREKYLSFYEKKGHNRLGSFPLIPQDDNSLLLINSGMAPLKKYFTGEKTMPGNRATTCQKCIRTPDIERVGITARHGTFFEMLGNFSFGDYFKEEATTWAWEFLTEELQIPKELLYITVYEDDDEAWDIWVNRRGIDPSHMKRMGKEDNFWEIGSGPCGPCSELYFDRGEKYGCGKPDCGVGCECDRFIEIWNLVFTQFVSDGKGNYERMAKGNIDTGMGLERLACVMQGVDNMFEVDSIANVIKEVEKISGVKYKEDAKTDISVRVITDHIRSTVFMISDGVMPSNEGRGYVLRRLLRRAARHGRMIGIKGLFLNELCDTVINESKAAYPELEENREYIKKVILTEEESFNKTIDRGMNILSGLIDNIEKTATSAKEKILSGIEAFKLNDTFGFPFDLTKEILAERGIGIDEEGFRKHLKEQADRARAARAKNNNISWADDLFKTLDLEPTEFLGYTKMKSECNIIAVAYDGQFCEGVSVDDEAKEDVLVILDKTPFYAEAGGQVADTGIIETETAVLKVLDCRKTGKGLYVHTCTLESGFVKVNTKATATLDEATRKAVMRNHTSAHLLQAALREVLGNHVHQSGSYVDSERMRFDFTHFSAVTKEELQKIEDLVNFAVLSALDVTTTEMSIEDAKKSGAMALFGEKYGDKVRVVKMGEFSTELCGGTHVSNTSHLGLFKITSESSVAAGIRRIEAVTGAGVLKLIEEKQKLIDDSAKSLKLVNSNELPAKVAAMVVDAKVMQGEIEHLKAEIAKGQISDLFANPTVVDGINVYTAQLSGTAGDELKQLCLMSNDKDENGVMVLCGENEGKYSLAVGCGKAVVAKGVKAGALVKAVAMLTGGNGGGKPDVAMAGVKDAAKVDEALAQVAQLVKEML
ncbi:MAG: alanine--tRNA ligase, partial [Ruminococcaceae bacterium]|nr:alanine--tRNA ligase [Oscillospiraceae bacterium]